ncbi:cinnamoyl-CoA reductase, putative [Talaromyces stipitatus ATCC 10500]|uniref:Cinnamoyl-CoA reductase, putative n=1 Tax=Talaromyces stipitatus (strain ATCC 10500 / CBS 375.48 / QM 6759 / NRRL 1006) TaxID=441959 RepID=B8LYK0_TALSN|nr:cinnamoyl-CoA reductase, putative [Talaromyces stipitatus ATCC 10500]EED23358.1 cinnamoyl-CoA reductase, putative [Talaromyces stipitatus ATCC 10500]
MPPQNLALPPDSLILVTGANSYIGSHVVNSLLEFGYRVRGTTREPKPWLSEYFSNKYDAGKYEGVIVPRLDAADALKKCIKGVDGVVHVASDMSFSPDPTVVIPKMINTMENIMSTVAQEDTVKRFVLTSSSGAVLTAQPDVEIVVYEDTWNDFTVRAAWDKDSPEELRGGHVYRASKVEVERAAWKFVEEKKPKFVFNAVLPNVNFGRILHPQIHGSSMGYTRNVLKGDSSIMSLLPAQWFIDVEDTAKLHVIALLDPEVQFERIFGFAELYYWKDVLAVIRKLRPADCGQLVSPPEYEGRDLSKVIPRKRAEELLQRFYGKGWTTLEDSIAAGFEGFEI